METSRVIMAGWPALMAQETAARYLSLDEPTFIAVASRLRLTAVDLEADVVRWRKADLDAMLKRLPARAMQVIAVATTPSKLDSGTIVAIADAVAVRLARTTAADASALASIKSASMTLGLGRSTIYKLIAEGVLTTRKIGGRTLIPRSDIDRLASGHA